MPERVVFDTNIWISGLLWRGKPYQCLLLARSQVVRGDHHLLDLGEYEGVRVLSAAEFLAQFIWHVRPWEMKNGR